MQSLINNYHFYISVSFNDYYYFLNSCYFHLIEVFIFIRYSWLKCILCLNLLLFVLFTFFAIFVEVRFVSCFIGSLGSGYLGLSIFYCIRCLVFLSALPVCFIIPTGSIPQISIVYSDYLVWFSIESICFNPMKIKNYLLFTLHYLNTTALLLWNYQPSGLIPTSFPLQYYCPSTIPHSCQPPSIILYS